MTDVAAAEAELDALEARFGAADLGALRADLIALEPRLAPVPDVHVRALSDLGVVDHALGDLPGAAAWLERALAVDPAYVPALENLAELLESAGDVLQAAALWRGAVRHAPTAETALAGAARTAAAIGQVPRATSPLPQTPRLLIAVDRFHPSSGGSERLAEDAAVALRDRGWDVEIVTRTLPERADRRHRGLLVHEIDASNPKPGFQAVVAAGGFDAILAFAAPLSWPILEPLTLPHPRPRVVVVPCVNGDGDADLRSDVPRLRRYAALLGGADAVGHSSLAGFDRRVCEDLGIASHYVPNAVHAAQPEGDVVTRLGLDGDTPLLLVVGNQWPEKNHLGLLAHLRDHDDDVNVVLVGGSSAEYPDLAPRIAAAAAQDPRVVLAGPLGRAEVAALMRAATVFLLPSKVEATPLVVLEAMSQRLPWIATPSCGAVHDHAGGEIVELDRFLPTARALIADEPRRRALAESGRAHWEAAYSWERVAERYDALLRGARDLPPLVAPAAVAA